MADEPERRITGALLVELEEQAKGPFLAMGLPDSGGAVLVDGEIDVSMLARAVMREAGIR